MKAHSVKLLCVAKTLPKAHLQPPTPTKPTAAAAEAAALAAGTKQFPGVYFEEQQQLAWQQRPVAGPQPRPGLQVA